MNKKIITLALLTFSSLNIFSLSEEIKSNCRKEIESNLIVGREQGAKRSFHKFEKGRPEIVVLSGYVTTHFLEVIDNLPESVTTLGLALPSGGHAIAALMIAEKIREKGLNTYVGLTRCHSACTILFQAGAERIVDKNSWFTYHGPSNASNNQACHQEMISYGQQQMLNWGFPQSEIGSLVHNHILQSYSGKNLYQNGAATQMKSLDIGNDGDIRAARESMNNFCEENPEDDDC